MPAEHTSRIRQYPGGPQPVVSVPVDAGIIWGTQINDFGEAAGDLWWRGDGTETPMITFNPNDADAWLIGDLGGTQSAPSWPAGGSDGTYIFHPVISGTGQWYIDRYTADLELVDRFAIPNWNSIGANSGGYYFGQNGRIKHLASGLDTMVVLADRFKDPDHLSFEFSVFQTDGTWVRNISIDTPPDGSGFRESIQDQGSGSCLDFDETEVFFCVATFSGDSLVVSVNLTNGFRQTLFNLNTIDTAISAADPSWSGLQYALGILELDGDLIISGFDGIARIDVTGNPVWWDNSHKDIPFADHYAGLAFSGRDTVWVSHSVHGSADEFTYDGVFVQSINLPEPAQHAWLVGDLKPIGESLLGPKSVRMATVVQTSQVRLH